jgi:hypothetical protein
MELFMSDNQADTAAALTTIIAALTPLNSEQRKRTVGAAMIFLGETHIAKESSQLGGAEVDNDGDGTGLPANVQRWMKQNGVSADELEQVFQFNGDGTFDLLDAPGKTKKEKMLNTYVLAGLGKFLTTNDRNFDEATARTYCKTFGCYDQANHAAHMRDRGNEFTGDKSTGYTLTNPGVKRGAALVKELVGAGK